jgi:hypothetical protein
MPDMFEPAPNPDDEDLPKPSASALSKVMDTGDQAPQSDAEHADNKQGWLNWFANPAVSNALLQFGANMLQPRYHQSEAGMIGQSLGAAGEAMGRVGENVLARQKQAADIEEQQQHGAYYKAETEALPVEAAAKKSEAETAASKIPFMYQQLQDKEAFMQERNALQQQAMELRSQGLGAQAELVQSKISELDAHAAMLVAQQQNLVPEWKKTALTSYYDTLKQNLGIGQPPPDPKAFGLTPQDVGIQAAAAGTTTATGSPATKAAAVGLIPIDKLNEPTAQKTLANLSESEFNKLYADYEKLQPGGGLIFQQAWHQAAQAAKAPPPVATMQHSPVQQPSLTQKILSQQAASGGHL